MASVPSIYAYLLLHLFAFVLGLFLSPLSKKSGIPPDGKKISFEQSKTDSLDLSSCSFLCDDFSADETNVTPRTLNRARDSVEEGEREYDDAINRRC